MCCIYTLVKIEELQVSFTILALLGQLLAYCYKFITVNVVYKLWAQSSGSNLNVGLKV